jgi:hypothetical protein
MPNTIPTRLVWAKISTAQPITAATNQSALIGAFSLSADAVASRVLVSRPPTTIALFVAGGRRVRHGRDQQSYRRRIRTNTKTIATATTMMTSGTPTESPSIICVLLGRTPARAKVTGSSQVLGSVGRRSAAMFVTCAQVGGRRVSARRGIRARSTQRAALQTRQSVRPPARWSGALGCLHVHRGR